MNYSCSPPVAATADPSDSIQPAELAVRIQVVDVPPGANAWSVHLDTPLWPESQCIGPLTASDSLNLESSWKETDRFVVRAVENTEVPDGAIDKSGLLHVRIGPANPDGACLVSEEEGIHLQVHVPEDLPLVGNLMELDPEDLQLLSELMPAVGPHLLRGPLKLLELECSLFSGVCLRKETCRPSTCANRGECQLSVTGELNFQEHRVSCICQAGFSGPYCRTDR